MENRRGREPQSAWDEAPERPGIAASAVVRGPMYYAVWVPVSASLVVGALASVEGRQS